jgi:hypothetical protein
MEVSSEETCGARAGQALRRPSGAASPPARLAADPCARPGGITIAPAPALVVKPGTPPMVAMADTGSVTPPTSRTQAARGAGWCSRPVVPGAAKT